MEDRQTSPSFFRTPLGVVATVAAVAAGIYLWTAHEDHVLALLPFAFLAACPLMHLFMHGGHGHGGHSRHDHAGGDAPRRG